MTPIDPNDTEGRLRDATNAYTDTVEPAPDAWALLRERVDEGRRRQRSRTIGAAVVGAAVAAAVVAAMFLAGGSDGDLVVETPPATDGPTTTSPGAPSAQCDPGQEPRPRVGSTAVQVWFFCPDAGLSDSPLVPVWRVVEGTDPESIVEGALQALVDGPTSVEQERGFGSGIPEEVWGANVDATLSDGTVSFDVDYDLAGINNLSTSNMSLRWWYAIGATVFAIDGVEALDPSGACVGEFDCTMPFMPDLLDEANLGAQATSEDCSGARAILWEQVGDEPPPAVAATRFSIADAAAVCDWEALRALMADDFSYSFGFEPNADGAISYWQDAEAAGEPIMRTLAETLSQFTTESEGHYQLGDPSEPLGYRVVIREDGAWTAFIAGD